ncbi:MAG: tetraacyldisaccharide 4'-kinase [Bacteroidetes bacterium]|nr:tetraacyldisaccharide 4'-kinase [Bacteroidota bacterium]
MKLFRIIRYLLFPVAIAWWVFSHIKNFCYNYSIIKSKLFSFPVIVVGNLQVGGTGKTPLVKYLAQLLNEQTSAIVSRGYGRNTKGYKIVQATDKASDCGDEPLEYATTLSAVTVAVCEDRVFALEKLNQENKINLAICDDAFQHRKLKPGMGIVCTRYSSLFTDDFILPIGNLREPASGAKRADILVVTKCPATIALSDFEIVSKKINPLPHQHLFFSQEVFLPLYTPYSHTETSISPGTACLLFCGIAHPEYLCNYLKSLGVTVTLMAYRDHHPYKTADLLAIQNKFDTIASAQKMIITTMKDYMRIKDMPIPFQREAFFIQPVGMEIIRNEKNKFEKLIADYVRSNSKNS